MKPGLFSLTARNTLRRLIFSEKFPLPHSARSPFKFQFPQLSTITANRPSLFATASCAGAASHSFLVSSATITTPISTPQHSSEYLQYCSIDLSEIDHIAQFLELTKDISPEELFPHLPVLTLSEVKSLLSPLPEQVEQGFPERVVIIQGDYIYDLTEFAQIHPGGARILEANHDFADPFWFEYTIHKTSPNVFAVLNEYRIGILHPEDRAIHHKNMEILQEKYKNEKWKYEPKNRNKYLKFLSVEPCNAETPLHLVHNEFITPSCMWFIRNHHPCPVSPNPPPQGIAITEHELTKLPMDTFTKTVFLPYDQRDQFPIRIELKKELYDTGRFKGQKSLKLPVRFGNNEETINIELELCEDDQIYATSLTIAQLKQLLEYRNIINSIICSGNRRDEMNTETGSKTEGLTWANGALSTGDFGGVAVSDLFSLFGIDFLSHHDKTDYHCVVRALDAPFDTSIPIHHALNPEKDVLLSFDMNNSPLSPDQGYPVRFLLPGCTGNRQVKWVGTLRLDSNEAVSPWHISTPYRYSGPATTPLQTPSDLPPVYYWPVFSSVLQPSAIVGYDEHDDNQDISKIDPTLTEPASVTPHQCGDKTLLSLRAQLIRNFPSQYNTNNCLVEDLKKLYQCIDLEGMAYAGNGVGIARVDTSVIMTPTGRLSDKAMIWTEATLQRGKDKMGVNTSLNATRHNHWAWALWQSEVILPKDIQTGDMIHVTSKAIDNTFNTQPETSQPMYNGRGILNNSWHKHPVIIKF